MTTTEFEIGAFLSSEEHGPREILRIAAAAAAAGFHDHVVSDHYHPWIDAQGHSPFVWSVLGALASGDSTRRLGTGITCPTIRIHPAIVAQAAATTAVLSEGCFFLGVGTGENLNEHVLADRWPPASERLDMLEEAVTIMRSLWTGESLTHEGRHYRVEDARLYDVPEEPPPILMSAFGEQAARLAAEIGDGLVTTSPDRDTLMAYRDAGGEGPAIACAKMCWAPGEDAARRTYFRLWPTSGVPGQLSQDLRTPALFEQAIQVVSTDDAVGDTPVGPDPERHAAALREYAEAGFDQVYLQQVGTDQVEAYAFLRDEVLPRL